MKGAVPARTGMEGVGAGGSGLLLSGAAGLALGALVVLADAPVLAVLAGGLFVPWLMACHPLPGLVILLAGTTFISIFGSLPLVKVKSIHVPDLLLGLLFAVAAWDWWVGRIRFTRLPERLPYLCYLGFATLVLLYWTAAGEANLLEAVREFKVLLYYGLFLLVPALAPDARLLRNLVLGAVAVGVLASLNLIGGALARPPAVMAAGEAFYYGFRGLVGEGGGVLLVYWSVCLLFAAVLVSGFRFAWGAALASNLLFYLLKFHRHMYVIIALSLAGVAALAFRENRRGLWRTAVACGAGLVLLGGLLAWGPRALGQFASLSFQRLESLQGIKETRTVTMRLLENRHALEAIRKQPLIGIGFARSYRPAIYGPDDRMNAFIHNGYLWILLKTGAIGFLLFLWFSAVFLRRAFGGWRRVEDRYLRAVVLGSGVCYAGIMIANFTSPYFMQDWSVAVIGIMIGVSEAALRLPAAAPAGRSAP